MKLYSFSLFGAVIALSFGTAGLHFKSVKPLAVSTSQPAAISMPQESITSGGTATLNLKTMKIVNAPTGFVYHLPGGGVANPLSVPLPAPQALQASPEKPKPLTGTQN